VEYFNNNVCSTFITYHRNLYNSLNENLTYLQLAFHTAKHEATGATPLKVIFPFHGDMPLLHQWDIHQLFPKIKPRPIHILKAIKTRLIRPQTQKSRTHALKDTTNTICRENCESSSWIKVSL
jgi:hypothetical protein